ncbi:hypothetical protein AAHA92_29155 [Salvia divinorum]|uniref:Uncharacterized protein n=1 Tax=Salvia divinorum TaxID=28513 RepID=A0ABD1FXE5_SALDI
MISSGWHLRRTNETMRLIITTFVGIIFGFFLGVSFPTLSLTKVNLSSNIFPSVDLTYIEDKRGISRKYNNTNIWVPTNPRGVPGEDLIVKPRYLMTFTVGYDQKDNIDAAVKKRTSKFCCFTMMAGQANGTNLSGLNGLYVSVRKQTKWWYAKRFLHPDIVAPYDYIFIWDEDLGVQNFNPEEYIKLVRKHGLDISQPDERTEVHKDTEERPGWCTDPHLPPCAAFVEIMAPVFSRDAWRCVWHMIQNDLVHGWGLDFAMRKCVEPAHEKIGVVDAQWIVHQSVPSLGNQVQVEEGKAPWEGVRERCRNEWTMFQDRLTAAEKAYFEAIGIDPPNSTARD